MRVYFWSGFAAGVPGGALLVWLAIDTYVEYPSAETLWPPVIAAAFGALAAMRDLLTIFPDVSTRLLKWPLGQAYVLLHMAAGLGALLLVDIQEFVVVSNPYWESVIAGIAGPALFRLKVHSFRSGGEKAIGPGAILDAMIKSLRTHIDHVRAIERAETVRRVMFGVDFEKARDHAAMNIIAARQTMTSDEQTEFGTEIGYLRKAPLPPQTKSDVLGYLVIDRAGEKFLEKIFSEREEGKRPYPQNGRYRCDDPLDPTRFTPPPVEADAGVDEASGWEALDAELFGADDAPPADTPAARGGGGDAGGEDAGGGGEGKPDAADEKPDPPGG